MSKPHNEEMSKEADSDAIFKRYTLADGRTLEVTKDEFEAIVSVFEALLIQSKKLTHN